MIVRECVFRNNTVADSNWRFDIYSEILAFYCYLQFEYKVKIID